MNNSAPCAAACGARHSTSPRLFRIAGESSSSLLPGLPLALFLLPKPGERLLLTPTWQRIEQMAIECSGATAIHSSQVTVAGVGHSIPATDHARFIFGTTPGGPYTTYIGVNQQGDGTDPQAFTQTVPHTTLLPSTQYYFVLAHYDAGENLIEQSSECTFTTRAAGDENYLDCDTGSSFTRHVINVNATSPQDDFPVPLGADQIGFEVATAPGGPWTPATIVDTDLVTPLPNPGFGYNPDNIGASIAGLNHNTQYWVKFVMYDFTNTPIEEVICGPVLTDDRPNPLCPQIVTSNITQTSVDFDVTAGGPTENGGLGTFNGGDTFTLQISSTPGGPYTDFVSNPIPTDNSAGGFVNSVPPAGPLTASGLIPDTDYFYRVRLNENANGGGETGEFYVSPECGPVHTLAVAVPPEPKKMALECAPVCAPNVAQPLPGVTPPCNPPCDDGTDPGTATVNDVETHVLCDVQADGTSVQFIRRTTYNAETGDIVSSADQGLDGSPYAPTGTVGDCQPYRLCTPDSNVDLNGDCGPGQTPNFDIIRNQGVAPNSVLSDDATADPLCGGVWDRPSEASPFSVDESFRNATFDQPGPVTQGTAPYAGLTASPGWTGSNVDAVGQGWLQTSDINSGTNGIWQVPNPFSTAAGMTASVTFASHDGTGTPNGDGMAFVFTNGGIPPQSVAIGGFGNLGLENWQGGYVAIVLDEYGQTCSCGTGASAGGCGFCSNSISIQLAGAARIGAGCGCCTIAQANVAPHNISNDTGRANPGRLITSIIEEGGRTYVSASILWAGDAEPTVYFNRVDVTDCAGPSPATLRMALYGGSGGSFRSEHEYRDAQATAAGSQNWRAFPIVTDDIPPCVTSVQVEVCVDITVVEDTQDVGNGNPEAFLWLVNSATGAVLDRVQRSSQPSQVGELATMCVDATVPVAQLPNLRFYVGAETRDLTGVYGYSWENLQVNVAGIGCPVQPVRTLAISAPCPLDVRVIGGSSDGTPAPVTVVNTPSTFEDVAVCATTGGISVTAFRREVRAPDGNVTVTFVGEGGTPITPDTWSPGACAANIDTEVTTELGCANGVPFTRQMTIHYDTSNGAVVGPITTLYIASDGTSSPAFPANWRIGPCGPQNQFEHEILCDEANAEAQVLVVITYDNDGNPTAVYYNFPAMTTFAGDPATLHVCDSSVPDTVEIDQYDTAPVATCYENPPGTVTRWYSYERVTFNNTAPGTEISRVRHWTDGVNDQLVAPVGVQVDCRDTTVTQTIEPGCANGVPYNRHTTTVFYGSVPVDRVVVWVDSTGGVPLIVAPPGFELGDCPAAEAVYHTVVQDVLAGNTLNVPTSTDLVSWTVRNRSATTATLQVNGGAVLPLDNGETITASTDDPNGHLDDILDIDAGNGNVRLTTIRRL